MTEALEMAAIGGVVYIIFFGTIAAAVCAVAIVVGRVVVAAIKRAREG